MKKIPHETLFELDQKVTNLPNNGSLRRSLIKETANIFNVSESTVYRQLKALSLHSEDRKTRTDKGKTRILDQEQFYYYCQIIAALKVSSSNKQSHMLSTRACIDLLESGDLLVKKKHIKVETGILKVSTINKYLNQYYISPKDIFSEPTVNRFMAKYANQCWQFDITPSEIQRLPEQHPDDPRRVMLFSVVDDSSGISFSKYYYAEGEDTLTALDFLYYAFAKITIHNNELYGIPDFLYTDNGSFVKSRIFRRVMEKMGIKILSHLPKGKGGRKTTARAKGKSERHHRTVKSILEPIYKLSSPQTLEELNEQLAKFTAKYNEQRHRTLNISKAQAWKISLPKGVDLTMCTYEHYQTLLREPLERKVRSDASIQVNNQFYQLDSNFAGDTVIALITLNINEIYIEHNGNEYGPFFPCSPATEFGNYNHHRKSHKEEVADNVIEFSKSIDLNINTTSSVMHNTAQNVGVRFTSPVKIFSSQVEAKLAIAKYLGKPLANLSDDVINFIDEILERTLVNNDIIDAIDDYFSLKTISNKES